MVPVNRPPLVLDPALKPVPSTKHTNKVNRQGKDEEDITIASEDRPSLEFLKSVEKSNMKVPAVNNKDHKQVEKGPHLTLQRDRNLDETFGETWSIIKLHHSIPRSPAGSCQTWSQTCASNKVYHHQAG